jgi:hypothetical protein
MAPSSLASATHDRSLGLSASTLLYSYLRELWRPTLVPPFHETLRSDVDFSPLVLATSRLREFQCRAPMPLSHESPKSRITLFSGATAQLSPFTTMACGTFRRVHVAFNDVIGSHHSRLSSRLTGTWYAFMHPSPIQAWNPTVRFPPQINGVDLLAFQSFREFAYRDFHTPVRFKRDLNPTHTLQIRRSRGSTFPPEQILRFSRYWCGDPISPWP